MGISLKDFDYNLPRELIAQEPNKPRDHSRLLLLNKETGEIKHKRFFNIVDELHKGDVLVLNNSKVFPARLIGQRRRTGGKVEVFLLKKSDLTALSIPGAVKDSVLTKQSVLSVVDGQAVEPLGRDTREVWQCLIGGKRRKKGLIVEFSKGLKGRILKNNGDGTFKVEFNKFGDELMKIVNKIGQTPLPPYIRRGKNGNSGPTLRQAQGRPMDDRKNYQNVYADDAKTGSVAAPTAGFHFTPELIKKLKKRGVRFEYITLHVGLGTFAPVKIDDITKHKMHAERVEVDADTIKRIYKAKQDKRRIIAVGTTSVRTLEAVFKKISNDEFRMTNNIRNSPFAIRNFIGWVDIFIYPGYEFKVIDAMITNFHLPKSTLLMLVGAFCGRKNILNAYKEAIKKKYRFYSYGDVMLIY